MLTRLHRLNGWQRLWLVVSLLWVAYWRVTMHAELSEQKPFGPTIARVLSPPHLDRLLYACPASDCLNSFAWAEQNARRDPTAAVDAVLGAAALAQRQREQARRAFLEAVDLEDLERELLTGGIKLATLHQ